MAREQLWRLCGTRPYSGHSKGEVRADLRAVHAAAPPPEIECEQDYEQCLAEGYGEKCSAILEQCMQPPPPPDCPAYEQCLAQGYGATSFRGRARAAPGLSSAVRRAHRPGSVQGELRRDKMNGGYHSKVEATLRVADGDIEEDDAEALDIVLPRPGTRRDEGVVISDRRFIALAWLEFVAITGVEVWTC